MPFVAQHVRSARLHLQKSDPVMKALIKKIGPFTQPVVRDRYLALVRSIISQQISGAAARTIQQRLIDAVAPARVEPETMLQFSIGDLRQLGISQQKAGYLLDLSEKVARGTVDLKNIGRQSDEAVIEQLTQVKGIGVWTAQMFLIFSLARLDVFPVGDLGIQNSIEKHYPIGAKLTKEEMLRIAKPWRPYATIASWYLWRSLDSNADGDSSS